MKKKLLSLMLVTVLFSSIASAQIVIGPKGDKTSVKSIVSNTDKFSGRKSYKSSKGTPCRFEGPFLVQLTMDFNPSFVVEKDSCSINLDFSYNIVTTDNQAFQNIILMNANGKKLTLEIDTSKLIYSDTAKTSKGFTIHANKCSAKISKEDYDILKEFFTAGGVEGAAYSTTGTSLPLKPKNKDYQTLFTDLEKAVTNDYSDLSFENNDGVITISQE